MPQPDDTQHHDESNGIPEAAPAGAASSEGSLTPELSVSPNSIEGLFLQALQLPSPADREAFLDRSCHNDPENRRRVLALLRAHADAGDFMENPAVDRPANAPVSLGFLKPSDKECVLGTIGPYEVLEAIGRGGMGVVLRAMDPKLNRIVAVKALLPELASNPNSRRRFLREAQAAAAVSHPHVVSIHAVDDSDQDHRGTPQPPFLVMECIVGQSLQQKLDKVGPLRLTEILRISRQISDGLAAAHKQGLVHRDIKPANILLENGVERVKITDFGLARAIDDITVTRTGEVCGTPQYMSPEQACGDRVDHRSDLFSLGCVMYAMCTGHSPFRGDSVAHVIKRVTQDEPRSIADQNPEIPVWLIEIITCLLQKSPEHRLQTAERLVEVLDRHLSRIQHPNQSGSHSAINQQIHLSRKTKSSESPEPTFRTTTSTHGINSTDSEPNFFGPIVQVPTWMRVASYTVLAAIAICVLIYSASLIDSGLLPNALEMGMVGAILLTGPLLMSLILCRRTARQLVIFCALFLGLSMFGVIVFWLIKNRLKPVNETDSLNSSHNGTRETPQTKWLSYRFAVLTTIVVAASFLILPSLWLVSLVTRDAINGDSISFLNEYFWSTVFVQKLPALLAWGTAIAVTSVTFLAMKARAGSATVSTPGKINRNATSENVYMQFGQIITPVPLEAALHYTNVKSIGRAWILLTLVGFVLSLVLHPTFSLEANSTQLISQAFQYPAFMIGIWIMSLLGTKIFTPTVPLRRWALLSSTMLGCMALGYFWTTVARIPFSGNLNEISSRSLIGAAIIPTMIFLTYCFWVYLEFVRNPKSIHEVQKLAGPEGLHSSRSYVVLAVTVPLLLGGLSSILFNSGIVSNPKPSAPPTVEVRKEGSAQSANKKIASDEESTQWIPFKFYVPDGVKVRSINKDNNGEFITNGTNPFAYQYLSSMEHRVHVSDVPGRPNAMLVFVLDVRRIDKELYDRQLSTEPVRIDLANEDFTNVENGKVITKVIYLPNEELHANGHQTLKTLGSSDVDEGIDVVTQVEKLGTIIAILRSTSLEPKAENAQ